MLRPVSWSRYAAAAAGLLLVVPAVLSAAAPVVPNGTWTLSGRHSERGTYTGSVVITRGTGGVYRVEATWVFGANDRETLTGTGRMYKGAFTTRLTVTHGSMIEHLDNPAATGGTEILKGTYTLSKNRMRLAGSWTSSAKPGRTGRETLRLGAPTTTKVDLALVRPDGSELAEDKEETAGEALPVNLDDDDNDGGAGAHGQNVVVSDLDDANGVAGENDLLALKVKKVAGAPAGSVLRLEWPDARVGIYRNADHTGRCAGGAVELPPGDETTLHVEGRSASAPGTPEALTLKLVSAGKTLGEDKVNVWVCRSAFLLSGHGSMGSWQVDDYLRTAKKDARTDPGIVAGKDAGGKPVYWAVFTWNDQKMAKIALSTPNGVVAYDGHSNFGMGYAFDTGFKSVQEFMNIAPDQCPVNWEYLREHQEHPNLMFAESEYADDAATTEKFDPVQVDAPVKGKHGSYDHAAFPVSGGHGARMHLKRGAQRWQDHHYSLGGADNVRIVVKAGSADMPAKKWDALYLHSCYSGQYYWHVFDHGTLFYTTEEGLSYNTTCATFLQSYIEGKSLEETLKAMNKKENINDYWQF